MHNAMRVREGTVTITGVIPTAGGLYVHKGTVFCRNIKRNIQRYWILRRLCRSISCSASLDLPRQVGAQEEETSWTTTERIV
jgi:hypothetical protein